MPAIRPQAVSNAIRLSYKLDARMRSLVAEHGAVDAGLRLPCSVVNAGVSEFSPHEKSIPCRCAQAKVVAWADESEPFASISVVPR